MLEPIQKRLDTALEDDPASDTDRDAREIFADPEIFELEMMKRYGTTKEPAAAILFLASDEASYITGITLPVAGGGLG